MEQPEGVVLALDLLGPDEKPGAVGRALAKALRSPLIGAPRRPQRVRVGDPTLVAEIRAELGDGAAIDVAPTPALDAFVAEMEKAMPPDEGKTYLEGGSVPASLVEYLFRNAEMLYRAAPWKLRNGDLPLRVDIPELGVEGACVALMGGLGESFGFLMFPSLTALEAFADSVDRMESGHASRPVDIGSEHLALEFEPGSALSSAQRKEVAQHGWPVADATAYPVVTARERDGVLRPLEAREVRILALCAGALASFAVRHREVFESPDAEPCCESITDELAHGATVTLTAPYEAFALFELEPAATQPASKTPAFTPTVARNAPCPCGSGKKYKRCHLMSDEARAAPTKRTDAIYALDERLIYALFGFGRECWGERFVGDARVNAIGEATGLQLPFAMFAMRIDGSTPLERYLAARHKRLSAEERSWLRAQAAAWLSVWEATEVEPGVAVTFRDLLSGEARRVSDISLSHTIRVRDALLARVVDHAGLSLVRGLHPRSLAPRDAAALVAKVRKRLRVKGAAPVAKLRDESFYRYLVGAWERAVRSATKRAAQPVDLRNTDGDPFLLTADHFDFAAADRRAIEERLAALTGVEREHTGDEGDAFVFTVPGNRQHKTWHNTIVGRAELAGVSLRLETNSRERADALRARVEDACAGLLRHRAREHADPLSERGERPRARGAPPPPEAVQLALDFKTRHYEAWLDEPVPALAGKTPREAAATAPGRAALDLLLKEIEQAEASDRESAYDVGRLRRELGVE
jgi:hypothetical protein